MYEVGVRCERARKLLKGPVKRVDFANPARRKEVRHHAHNGTLAPHTAHPLQQMRPAVADTYTHKHVRGQQPQRAPVAPSQTHIM